MAVDNISNMRTYTSNGIVVETGKKKDDISQGDFLRLMTTQLQNQDPFNPMDGTQMLGQMAQFSNVTGIAEMNTTLKQIETQLSDQGTILKSLITGQADGTATGETGEADGTATGDSTNSASDGATENTTA